MLTLGEPGNPDLEQAVEEWLLRQPTLTLPGSGGLVLPLAYGRFLVGILIVEQEHSAESQSAPAAAAPAPSHRASSSSATGAASANARHRRTGRTAVNERHVAGRLAGSHAAGHAGGRGASGAGPDTSWTRSPEDGAAFTAEQLRWIDRVAHGLAMACALDQRAALERAGNQADRLRVRGLVEEVRRVPIARGGMHGVGITLEYTWRQLTVRHFLDGRARLPVLGPHAGHRGRSALSAGIEAVPA